MIFSRYLITLLFLTLTLLSNAQWTHVTTAPDGYINDIVIVQDTIYLAHGSHGVYRSPDNAQSWELLDEGLNNMQAKNIYQLLVMGDTLFAATVDGIYRSTDKGENWIKKSNGIQVGGGAIYAFTKSIYNHEGTLITGAFTGIYQSDDWGESWEVTNVSGSHVYPQVFTKHNGILFGARESNNTPYGYQSVDDGLTWTDMTIGQPTICFLSEPGRLWCGTIDGVWLSEDNGTTWEQRNNGLSLDPYSAGLIRVGDQLITSLKFGGSGVFRSFDDGHNWEDFSEGLGFFNIISKLVYNEGILYVVTSDGVWQRELNVTSASEYYQKTGKIQIQNYPNPFLVKTQISFMINEDRHIRLEILNNRGKVIYILVDGHLESGYYDSTWQGIDMKGNPVSSGLYFYRLIAGDEREVRRMVKVK